MLPYIFFIAIILILIFLIEKYKDNKWIKAGLIATLILFSGLRYAVGSDYIMYENMYFKFGTGTEFQLRTGFGFYILCKLFLLIFPYHFVPLMFFLSVVTVYCIYRFSEKNSVNLGLSILLFVCLGFYTMSFNIFRQMLSTALVLYSYNFLKDKKHVRYILLSICAVAIHNISIIAVIAILFFTKIFHKKFNSIFLFICGIVGIVLYNVIYSFIVTHIKALNIYISDDSFQPGIGTFLQVLIYGVFFIVVNLKSKDLVEKNKENLVFINIFSCSYVFMMLAVRNILFMRVANYLNIFIILLLPELYEIYKIKDKKVLNILMYVALIIYFLVYINSFGSVVPYYSVFNLLI